MALARQQTAYTQKNHDTIATTYEQDTNQPESDSYSLLDVLPKTDMGHYSPLWVSVTNYI